VTEPRVLCYDIETAPLQVYTWSPWQANAAKVVHDWQMLSVAWRWHGEKRVSSASIPDWRGYKPLEDGDDYEVVATVADLFDEADVVVAHNGNKFDQPKTKTRMIAHGFDPPSSYKEVDTLQIVKQQFRFTYSRLDEVCKALGIGAKHNTGGIDLWHGCINGDPKAWAKMVKYNKQDVVLLDALYERVLPWAKNAPNMALLSDRPDVCPRCGRKGEFIIRGYRHNQVTKRVQYQCTACRGYVAGRRIIKDEAYKVS
jgi:hypothetical protein